MSKHQLTVCKRNMSAWDTAYVGKGWKSRFVCPQCQRETWQALNFLGSRLILCDGEKLRKVRPETAHE